MKHKQSVIRQSGVTDSPQEIMPLWYYDKKDLRNTPSFENGLDPEAEARYRREGARFIINTGTKMGLRYDTMATGVVYFHRFYMFHTFKDFPRYVTACCCLFLAGKVEETPKKCKDIIKTARGLLSDHQFAQFGEDPKEEVMTLERILLQTIKFDLQVDHPYGYLLKYAKSLKGDKQKLQKMVQMAWTFVNDSLCTSLCLQWEPEIIAIALMYLAGKLSKFEVTDWVARNPKQSHWWDMFVDDISIELLEDICHQVLDLYSNTPSAAKTDSPPTTPPIGGPGRTPPTSLPQTAMQASTVASLISAMKGQTASPAQPQPPAAKLPKHEKTSAPTASKPSAAKSAKSSKKSHAHPPAPVQQPQPIPIVTDTVAKQAAVPTPQTTVVHPAAPAPTFSYVPATTEPYTQYSSPVPAQASYQPPAAYPAPAYPPAEATAPQPGPFEAAVPPPPPPPAQYPPHQQHPPHPQHPQHPQPAQHYQQNYDGQNYANYGAPAAQQYYPQQPNYSQPAPPQPHYAQPAPPTQYQEAYPNAPPQYAQPPNPNAAYQAPGPPAHPQHQPPHHPQHPPQRQPHPPPHPSQHVQQHLPQHPPQHPSHPPPHAAQHPPHQPHPPYPPQNAPQFQPRGPSGYGPPRSGPPPMGPQHRSPGQGIAPVRITGRSARPNWTM